jgi:hypothetical protein
VTRAFYHAPAAWFRGKTSYVLPFVRRWRRAGEQASQLYERFSGLLIMRLWTAGLSLTWRTVSGS